MQWQQYEQASRECPDTQSLQSMMKFTALYEQPDW